MMMSITTAPFRTISRIQNASELKFIIVYLFKPTHYTKPLSFDINGLNILLYFIVYILLCSFLKLKKQAAVSKRALINCANA